VEGIDEARTTPWLAAHAGLEPPLEYELIAGGRSNLTFRVTDRSGTSVALRRPPVAHVLPTAHDMRREHRIVSALSATPVPVPETLALCEDESVNGAPFYVMQYVDGHIVRDQVTAEKALDPTARRRASESLVEVLVALHAVDVDAVGLGDLARREGYLSRQLERWHGQFDKSQVAGHERPGRVDDVYERLAASVPEQRGATIVHGDYRLDNTVLGGAGEVIAVLDWELCTLGDPLADVGLLFVYWSEPGNTTEALGIAGPTLAPGFLRRRDLRQLYESATGRDLSGIGYYVAFGYWKLACILQGVFARYVGGAGGGDRSGIETLGGHVHLLAEAAEKALVGAV
jgi:aminoglycoside phosphotransferase (APT) family kinase protein